MIDAPNGEAAFSVLNDSDLRDNILGIKPEQFEESIKQDNIQLKNLLEPIIENQDLYALIFLFEDFFNIKLIFKEKYLGIEFNEKEYSQLGIVEISDLRAMIMNEDDLPEFPNNHLSENIINIKKSINNEDTGFFIDAIIDKEYLECSIELAKKIKNEFILNFLYLSADASNARAVLRAKKIGFSVEETRRQLTNVGRIKIESLLERFESEDKELIDFIKNTLPYLAESEAEYGKIWEEIFESYYINHDIIALEKQLSVFKLKFARDEAKKLGYGAEIIFYYAYLKELMNTNIRLILMGKLNQMPVDEIKMRLRI